ncbi:DsbC family protein [Thiohalobacter sp. IOR34]|uniref:DsbC family protein n=1 Tax=Thiohalobacter sp. IOR34 TaxID=3057176 RepID=UPI0025AF8789|nr:DsbC family protein [Thiohalobacter sp. IOR34]WJW74755.1 DsbC family protein [Thiohalobacter sp. IOR34]
MRLIALLLFALLSLSGPLQAADAPAVIRDALKRILPDSEPDSIQPSPIEGLYEVAYGPQIVYVSADGRFLMQGNLIDLNSGANLTAHQRSRLLKGELEAIGEDNMVIFPAKSPKHTITVFTDIDCGYCRKLHSEIGEINRRGITVRYLFFPRAGPGSASWRKAEAVWCAKDRLQALTDSKNGKSIESPPCETPVARHYQLVQALNLRGTPAIILENGRIVPGYLPAAKLEAMLEGGR